MKTLLEAALLKLFPRETPDAETRQHYEATLGSFGAEWEVAGTGIDLRYRYADSLYAAGAMERRITLLRTARGDVCGNRIEFRACGES